MDIALQTLIETYTDTFASTLMDVLAVVVPAGVALLAIKLVVNWGQSYFKRFAR